LILTIGLGFPPDADFAHFGEESDDKVRAAKLDEGLAILTGLWQGKPFSFEGEYYVTKDFAWDVCRAESALRRVGAPVTYRFSSGGGQNDTGTCVYRAYVCEPRAFGGLRPATSRVNSTNNHAESGLCLL
jgi:hypothetical protein